MDMNLFLPCVSFVYVYILTSNAPSVNAPFTPGVAVIVNTVLLVRSHIMAGSELLVESLPGFANTIVLSAVNIAESAVRVNIPADVLAQVNVAPVVFCSILAVGAFVEACVTNAVYTVYAAVTFAKPAIWLTEQFLVTVTSSPLEFLRFLVNGTKSDDPGVAEGYDDIFAILLFLPSC